MSTGPAPSRRRIVTAALLLCGFALVLSVAPIFHHDFECHLKSPTHCPACVASPAADGPTFLSPGASMAAPTAATMGPLRRAPDSPPLGILKDRSPPF